MSALTETVRKLPADELAWARQAKVIWTNLVERLVVSTNPRWGWDEN